MAKRTSSLILEDKEVSSGRYINSFGQIEILLSL